MAYGDVGGPNLDFSNMGCMGFCPEMFSFGDWLLIFTLFTAVLYISYWIIKIAIRLIKHSIKTYKLKNENVGEGFSVIQKEFEERQKEEKKGFNLKKELAVLWYCGILGFLIIAFLTIAFS